MPCTAGRHQHAGDKVTALQPAALQAPQDPASSGNNFHPTSFPTSPADPILHQRAEHASLPSMRALRGIPVDGRQLPATRRLLPSQHALVPANGVPMPLARSITQQTDHHHHIMGTWEGSDAPHRAASNPAVMHPHDSTSQGCSAEQRHLQCLETLDSLVLMHAEGCVNRTALGSPAVGFSREGLIQTGPFQVILDLMTGRSFANQAPGDQDLPLGTQAGILSQTQLHPGHLPDITGNLPASADQSPRQDADIQMQTYQRQRHPGPWWPGGPESSSLPISAHQGAESSQAMLDVQQMMGSSSQCPLAHPPGGPHPSSLPSSADQGSERPQDMLDVLQSLRSSSQCPVANPTPAQPVSPGSLWPFSDGPPTVDGVVECLQQAVHNPCNGLEGV